MNLSRFGKIGAVVVLVFMMIIPSLVSGVDQKTKQTDGQVFLFVNGGFGVHFTVINENNESRQVFYDIYGEGLYVNTSWHTHGRFTAGGGVWTTSPPVFVPYSFMPITGYVYTDSGQMLSRRGVSLFGFVLFFM